LNLRIQRAAAGQAGFTLPEILIAAVIVGIALLALSQAIPIGAYGIQEGNQLSQATFLANQRLEQVRNAQWSVTPAVDNLGVSASSSSAPVSGGTTTFPDENPVAAPYGAYSRRVRIIDCNAGAGCGGIVKPGMREATVTVAYTPLTGVGVSTTTKAAEVTLIIAQR
jgi:prepilin-type N-terminal cleavage/methylation domain-containing protein